MTKEIEGDSSDLFEDIKSCLTVDDLFQSDSETSSEHENKSYCLANKLDLILDTVIEEKNIEAGELITLLQNDRLIEDLAETVRELIERSIDIGFGKDMGGNQTLLNEHDLKELIQNELFPEISDSNITQTISRFFASRVVQWANENNIQKEALKDISSNFTDIVGPIVDYFRFNFIPRCVLDRYISSKRFVRGNDGLTDTKKDYFREKIIQFNDAILITDPIVELIEGLSEEMYYLELSLEDIIKILYSDEVKDCFFEDTSKDVFDSCFNGYMEGAIMRVPKRSGRDSISKVMIDDELRKVLEMLKPNDCVCDFFRKLGLKLYEAGIDSDEFQSVYESLIDDEVIGSLVRKQLDLINIRLPYILKKVKERQSLSEETKFAGVETFQFSEEKSPGLIILETRNEVGTVMIDFKIGDERKILHISKTEILGRRGTIVMEAVSKTLNNFGIERQGDVARIRRAIGRVISGVKNGGCLSHRKNLAANRTLNYKNGYEKKGFKGRKQGKVPKKKYPY